MRTTTNEVDFIAPLFDQYRQFYKQEPNLKGGRSFLQERLSKNESVVFLALDHEQGAVGFVQLYPSFTSESMKRLWILNDLFVSPAARKRGVGATLMKEAEAFARKTDAKGLELETAIDNFPAQRLYERCGYRRNLEFHRYLLYF
jgi:ribosomal protein S18 acetylase RimI-like enzyme